MVQRVAPGNSAAPGGYSPMVAAGQLVQALNSRAFDAGWEQQVEVQHLAGQDQGEQVPGSGQEPAAPAPGSAEAETGKEAGNAAFGAGDYPAALQHYSSALRVLTEALPSAALLLNRAACGLAVEGEEAHREAFLDACAALVLAPRLEKAHYRWIAACFPFLRLDGRKVPCTQGGEQGKDGESSCAGDRVRVQLCVRCVVKQGRGCWTESIIQTYQLALGALMFMPLPSRSHATLAWAPPLSHAFSCSSLSFTACPSGAPRRSCSCGSFSTLTQHASRASGSVVGTVLGCWSCRHA